MQFYNRLTGQTQKKIPAQLLLGQWQILTEGESVTVNTVSISSPSRLYVVPDATKRCSVREANGSITEQLLPAWQIPSDLILESLRFFEKTLRTLSDQEGSWDDWTATPPLVHDIQETIRLQQLEKVLEKHLGHLEEICQHPRTYLKMETDRLPISRVKRISPHAAEFLAAHTEDWEKRTFRNVRPKRVLCLIREDLLDIYENKVTARLIDYLLEYLQKRITEVQALQKELEQADDFSEETQKIHWRNRHRICSLWGKQFQAGTALKTAQATLKILKQLQYKLRGLLDTELYRAIPKEANVGNTLKRTNILINDQHYRYVDRLWQAWNPWKRGHTKTTQEILETYQQGFNGFDSFCLLLISRALTGNGTEKDRGLGFEIDDLPKLQLGQSIRFNSPRCNIILTWQLDGTILLEADEIQNLKLIPLMLPLTATEDATVINHILEQFRSACSNYNGTLIILYPGTDDERQKLSQSLQQHINSLGNEYSTKQKALVAILPVSPLDILSVERIARAIQWWIYRHYCQIYPFKIEEKIPQSLLKLEQDFWIFQENLEYKLRRPPQEEEQNNFKASLSKLINQAKSQGAQAKRELLELEKINNFSKQAEERFKPLLICPTCYKKSDHFYPEGHCFRSYCKECKTELGTKICGKCGKRYPYIQLSDTSNILNLLSNQTPGWIDRVFGRDLLTIPNVETHENSYSFICPFCNT